MAVASRSRTMVSVPWCADSNGNVMFTISFDILKCALKFAYRPIVSNMPAWQRRYLEDRVICEQFTWFDRRDRDGYIARHTVRALHHETFHRLLVITTIKLKIIAANCRMLSTTCCSIFWWETGATLGLMRRKHNKGEWPSVRNQATNLLLACIFRILSVVKDYLVPE